MGALHLKKWPIPSGDTEDEIAKNPTLCRTCWNLYGGSAYTSIFIPTIDMTTDDRRPRAAQAAERGDASEAPTWAGTYRSDYAAFEFTITLADIPDSASNGCDSCLLLKIAVGKLADGVVDFGDPELRLGVTLCKGSVLRLALSRQTGVETDQVDLFGLSLDDENVEPAPLNFELLESWELYTSHGSRNPPAVPTLTNNLSAGPSPWPTIGTSMTKESPHQNLDPEPGGTAKHVCADQRSDDLYSTITGWIESCRDNHTLCKEVEQGITHELPKRVIAVGSLEDNSELRLLDIDATAGHVSYLALSHCWGKGSHLMTTTATLEERKRQIVFRSLSKTFRDAVEITRRLGFRYLWVDSLCIAQDDQAEKAIEIAKMASIYNGTACVLAATSSKDGDGGCLFARKPYVTIDGTTPDGEPFAVYGRRSLDHEVFGWGRISDIYTLNPSNMETMIDVQTHSHPLLTRAWCFQERMLATRVLHFTDQEVYMECVTGMSCECGALQDHAQEEIQNPRQVLLTGSPAPDNKRRTGSQRPKPRRDDTKNPLESDLFWVWRDLVRQYSQKRITYRSDGLLALAGIATKWSGERSGRYLAGIWEKDILGYLRWTPHAEDNGVEPEYVAPSWSWVSVHRAVTWPLQSSTLLDADLEYYVEADLSKTACHGSELNPFGDVTSGYIFLLGKITAMTLRHDDGGYWLEKPGIQERSQFALFDGTFGKPDSTFIRPDSVFRLRQLQSDQVYCLKLCNKAIVKPQVMGQYSALVLAPADRTVLGRQPSHVQEFNHVYQRLGIIDAVEGACWDSRDAQEVGLYLI